MAVRKTNKVENSIAFKSLLLEEDWAGLLRSFDIMSSTKHAFSPSAGGTTLATMIELVHSIAPCSQLGKFSTIFEDLPLLLH